MSRHAEKSRIFPPKARILRWAAAALFAVACAVSSTGLAVAANESRDVPPAHSSQPGVGHSSLAHLGALLGRSVTVGGAAHLGLPAGIGNAAPQAVQPQAQKLLIFLRRSQGVPAPQGALADSRAPPASAAFVAESISSTLERYSAQDLEGMPLEELNALSARVLEGILGRPASASSERAAAPAALESQARPALQPAEVQGRRSALEKLVPAPKLTDGRAAEEPPLSAAVLRVIKALGVARLGSISASNVYSMAFAGMAIGVVGRDVFLMIVLISAALGIPVALVHGDLTDRFTPRQMLLGASLVIGATALAAALLLHFGVVAAHPYLTLVPLNAVMQFMLLALVVGEGALVTKIIGGDKPKALQRTQAAFDLIFSGASTAASLAGGWLIAHWLGSMGAFLLYAGVTSVLLPYIYLNFVPKDIGASSSTRKAKPGFVESFSIVLHSPYLLTLLGLTCAAAFLIFPMRLTLVPILALKYFTGGSATLLGFTNTAVFVGMTLAGLFNTFLAPRISNAKLLFWSALAFPTIFIMVGWPLNVPVFLAGLTAMFMIQTIGANVVRSQYFSEAQNSHPEYMGRLTGINSAFINASVLGGNLLLKGAISKAAYPAVLRYLIVPNLAVMAAYFASVAALRWAWRKTHPDKPADPLK